MSLLLTRRSVLVGAGAAFIVPKARLVRAAPLGLGTPPRGLEYPAGRAPGFDPTHPAARNARASAVARPGGAMVNILTGTALVNNASVVAQTLAIGPAVQLLVVSATACSLSTTFSEGSAVITTMATITKINSVPSNGNLFVSYVGTGYVQLVTNNAGQLGVWMGSAYTLSGITLGTTSPYFIAASVYPGASGLVHFILVNMATGAVQTAFNVATTKTTGTITSPVFSVGSTGSTQAGMSTATAMLSVVGLSPAQLSAWAADPWGFWYPN